MLEVVFEMATGTFHSEQDIFTTHKNSLGEGFEGFLVFFWGEGCH